MPISISIALGSLAVALVVYYVVVVPASLRFQLTPESLQIRGDILYGRTIPRSQISANQAALIGGAAQAFQIIVRTNGVGLPNYQCGWFQTTLGKALVFRRPGRTVVSIPVGTSYTLLLTPANPEQFLAALQTPQSTRTEPLAQ